MPTRFPLPLKASQCYLQILVIVANKSTYSLLGTSYGILKWPVLQTLLPRACLTALSFCQPFLINHAITLSQEAINDETTQRGYGLIGAYFFVYVGIAVRPTPMSYCSLSPLFPYFIFPSDKALTRAS